MRVNKRKVRERLGSNGHDAAVTAPRGALAASASLFPSLHTVALTRTPNTHTHTHHHHSTHRTSTAHRHAPVLPSFPTLTSSSSCPPHSLAIVLSTMASTTANSTMESISNTVADACVPLSRHRVATFARLDHTLTS